MFKPFSPRWPTLPVLRYLGPRLLLGPQKFLLCLLGIMGKKHTNSQVCLIIGALGTHQVLRMKRPTEAQQTLQDSDAGGWTRPPYFRRELYRGNPQIKYTPQLNPMTSTPEPGPTPIFIPLL